MDIDCGERLDASISDEGLAGKVGAVCQVEDRGLGRGGETFRRRLRKYRLTVDSCVKWRMELEGFGDGAPGGGAAFAGGG